MKCPHCMVRNANHPAIILGKLLALAALCAAIWFLVQAFVKTGDTESGVIHPTPEKASPRR